MGTSARARRGLDRKGKPKGARARTRPAQSADFDELVTLCIRAAIAFDLGGQYKRILEEATRAHELAGEWMPSAGRTPEFCAAAIRYRDALDLRRTAGRMLSIADGSDSLDARMYRAARDGANDFGESWNAVCGLPMATAVRVMNSAETRIGADLRLPRMLSPRIRRAMARKASSYEARQKRARVVIPAVKSHAAKRTMRGVLAVEYQRIISETQDADAFLAALRAEFEHPLRPTTGVWLDGTSVRDTAIRRASEIREWADRSRNRVLARGRALPSDRDLEHATLELAARYREIVRLADEDRRRWVPDTDKHEDMSVSS